ncbi:MAG: hypothetical protein MMC33_008745 [Icmadophila ericetorum]|nr:hypothetical protein [Icmadophila ericetorum]
MSSGSQSKVPITFKLVFDRLQTSVSRQDATQFHSTTLHDVWEGARQIEKNLAARQAFKNMTRLRPLSKGIRTILGSFRHTLFEKLMDAYALIEECMPRLDHTSNAFKANPHKSFDGQFKAILERLERHRDLVDREVVLTEIFEAKAWIEKQKEQLDHQEEQRTYAQLQNVLTWLNASQDQEELLDKYYAQCFPKSCDWITAKLKVQSWLSDGQEHPLLWLRGIPGADSSRGYQSTYSKKFVYKGVTPCTTQLKLLLQTVLRTIPSVRLVIDRIDKLGEEEQAPLITLLLSLARLANVLSKIMFVSRDSGNTTKVLRSKPTVDLGKEQVDINRSIKFLVEQKLIEFRDIFTDLEDAVIKDLVQQLVQIAGGMFLWVRLVIDSLLEAHSVHELRAAVDSLPKGFDAAYGQMVHCIEQVLSPGNQAKAMRILQWVAFAYRPLKIYELRDTIAFHKNNCSLDKNSKLMDSVLDLSSNNPRQDPTMFSALRERYLDIVETLLKAKSNEIPVDPGILQSFRKTYAQNAYPCRFPACARASRLCHNRATRGPQNFA